MRPPEFQSDLRYAYLASLIGCNPRRLKAPLKGINSDATDLAARIFFKWHNVYDCTLTAKILTTPMFSWLVTCEVKAHLIGSLANNLAPSVSGSLYSLGLKLGCCCCPAWQSVSCHRCPAWQTAVCWILYV